MKIEYSFIKLSLIPWIYCISNIIGALVCRESFLIISSLIFSIIICLVLASITNSLSFTIDKKGFHRKWMNIQNSTLKWGQIKRLRKIPFLENEYFIERSFMGSMQFILLPMFFMKNKNDLLNYIKEHKPELFIKPKDKSFRLTK